MTASPDLQSALDQSLRSSDVSFRTHTTSVYATAPGLSQEVIEDISARKGEPAWMRELRLAAYQTFLSKPLPAWGPDLSTLDFSRITYYVQPQDRPQRRWEDVPSEIKDTFERLGIPQAERQFLAGVGAQFESDVIYHSLKEELASKGVMFLSMDDGLRLHPDIVKNYFGTLVPATDNTLAALNTAVWSGGSFVYVPKGVHLDLPLQAYFRINSEGMGQFERTLIIADEGSSVHYVEGCTAPTYSTDSLHSAVVEIFVHPRARVQYTTIQNWSTNVYNLVTKRAIAHDRAQMIWLDCNIGSKVTMKYPSIILRGNGSRGEIQSLAIARGGQCQDAGGKVIHIGKDTSSTITSKSISMAGGRASYRGLVRVLPGATSAKTRVVCDALLLDDASRSDTYPTMNIQEQDANIAHEATVSKISEDALFYLRSRGLSEEDAARLLVNGFAMPIIKQLPMEYAVELNRLIGLELKGAIA